MNAEILSVGTELLLGNIVNTDARDLSVMLSELGINVYWHSVVGDNPGRLKKAVALAKERADLIITTGGLGPTCDDLTKQTLAECFGLPLVLDDRAVEDLHRYFKNAAGLPMTDTNLQQAYLPEGCTPFYNTNGTAPGCAFYKDGVHVMMLPGPPRELHAMMEVSGIPYLRSLSTEQIHSHNIHTFGLGESFIEARLRDYIQTLSNPTLATYASLGEVRLRVTAKARNREEADEMMRPVIEKVREHFDEYIYGIDTNSLEETVFGILLSRGETLATAESCTGGLISKRLTDVPGVSAVFRGGVNVYTNDAKNLLLGVDRAVLDEKGAVSEEVAWQLAHNVREVLGADYGIGVTGLAGPDGDGVNEVGTVFVSAASKDKTVVRRLQLGRKNDRSKIRTLAANHALDLLRREFLK